MSNLEELIKIREEAIKEYKAVKQAIERVHKDSVYIFEELYRKGTSKWDIINSLNVSEETYKRRKRELIYAVYEEIIKNWPFFDLFLIKKRVKIVLVKKSQIEISHKTERQKIKKL